VFSFAPKLNAECWMLDYAQMALCNVAINIFSIRVILFISAEALERRVMSTCASVGI